jgi:hypothetical protein
MIIQIFNGSQKGVRCDSKIVRFDFEIVRYDAEIIHYDPENTVTPLLTKFLGIFIHVATGTSSESNYPPRQTSALL